MIVASHERSGRQPCVRDLPVLFRGGGDEAVSCRSTCMHSCFQSLFTLKLYRINMLLDIRQHIGTNGQEVDTSNQKNYSHTTLSAFLRRSDADPHAYDLSAGTPTKSGKFLDLFGFGVLFLHRCFHKKKLRRKSSTPAVSEAQILFAETYAVHLSTGSRRPAWLSSGENFAKMCVVGLYQVTELPNCVFFGQTAVEKWIFVCTSQPGECESRCFVRSLFLRLTLFIKSHPVFLAPTVHIC